MNGHREPGRKPLMRKRRFTWGAWWRMSSLCLAWMLGIGAAAWVFWKVVKPTAYPPDGFFPDGVFGEFMVYAGGGLVILFDPIYGSGLLSFVLWTTGIIAVASLVLGFVGTLVTRRRRLGLTLVIVVLFLNQGLLLYCSLMMQSHNMGMLNAAVTMSQDFRAKWMLRLGADYQQKTYMGGETPLDIAIIKSDRAMLEMLLDEGVPTEFHGWRGGTSGLITAIREDNREMAEYLLERGADVDWVTSRPNWPLREAVLQGNRELAEMLLVHGAEANQATGGLSALQEADFRGHDGMVELLLDYGADPAQLTWDRPVDRSDGSYANSFLWFLDIQLFGNRQASLATTNDTFIRLIQMERLQGIGTMLEGGRSVNGKGETLGMPLVAAVQTGNEEVVESLLVHGAEIDGVSGSYPPLFAAVAANDGNMVRYLIDHGADVNVTVNGVSALGYGLVSSQRDMVRELLKHGAKREVSSSLEEMEMLGPSEWEFLKLYDIRVVDDEGMHQGKSGKNREE